jgi:GDP/GTP exchange factor Sec2p
MFSQPCENAVANLGMCGMTAGKIADYENEVRSLRDQTQALNNHSDVRSASTASLSSESPDTNAQQGRFAGIASYFPYRRTNSRTGSKDSSTPPNTSHSNHTSSSPGGHTSPTSHRNYPQRSMSQQDSSDNNAAALQTALSREQSLRKAAESQLSQAHSELEELTAQLFGQANEMVAQERKARAKLEERVALLEKRDGEKRKRLDRLEKAIARVERVKELINS